MRVGDGNALRTRVYVDGYNLYYGCLKSTPYKWLDLRALIERILANIPYERDGDQIQYRLCAPDVKFFTAPILAAFARSADSLSCQAAYHGALRAHLGATLEILSGFHTAKPARAYAWIGGKSARESPTIDVWKLEEKQSDVALALHAYRDAARGEIEQIIAITNDSDFAPAMKMIRQDSRAILGLIAPARRETARVNAELARQAHWIRSHILDEELECSQLPRIVRVGATVLYKPLSWHPQPKLLLPIYEEAKRVRGSEGAARKWLYQRSVALGGRVPIEMCETLEGATELRGYMERYAKEFSSPISDAGDRNLELRPRWQRYSEEGES